MHQKCKFSGFYGKSHSNPLNSKLEKFRFLGGFVSKLCSQTHSAFSKRSRNNRKRKRKPRTFQNFKNYQKILIIKKVTSIFVLVGTIYTCLSVNPTFNDYIPYYAVRNVVREGRIYGQACTNSHDQYKNACNFLDNQYFFIIFEVLKSSRFPLAFSVVS